VVVFVDVYHAIGGSFIPANGEEMNSDDDDVDDDDEMDDSSGEDGDDDVYVDRISDEKIKNIHIEKFIRTFSAGEYDAEFDNALSLDRAVPLSSTRATQSS
jgi:hypothetical protein